MKKHGDESLNGEMKDHYDFSKLQRVDRTEYFERLFRERGGRFINSELAQDFPDDQSLNEALQEYLRHKRESA